MELKDKVAIVTGASSGIGEAIARDLRQAGMKIVLTGLGKEKLQAIAEDIGGEATARYIEGDVTGPTLPDALLKLALEAFGRADVLINNAGMMVIGPIETVDIDALCKMVRVDVEAAFRMAYVFVRHFKAQKTGFLLNTSSIAGVSNYPTMGAYCGSKHAIESLTDCLRLELAGSGVGVACIEPGVVQTNLYQNWSEDDKKALTSQQSLVSEDIARVVRFLLTQPAHVNIGRLLITPADQSA